MWVIFIVSAVVTALIAAVVIGLIYKIVTAMTRDYDERAKKENIENEENMTE
ncbi:MAG: hypothetical protein Q4G33_11365 [bacterium]|nr:hypothetical protein [bacterium]